MMLIIIADFNKAAETQGLEPPTAKIAHVNKHLYDNAPGLEL
jgi:hypothetical protein